MNKLLVSIIVPVYNVEPYIKKCIDSIIKQTYNGQIECLLIDDCGSDNSISVAEEQLQSYTGPIKFRIIHHEHNKGLSAARNTGLKAATGDYVYFLDSDDWIADNCIELLYAPIERNPSIQMVVGNLITEPQTEKLKRDYDLHNRNLPDLLIGNDKIRQKFYTEVPSIPINGVNKLTKRSFLVGNNLFFKEGIIHEDEQWSYFWIRKIEAIAFVKEFTYIHPINPNSIMTSSSKERSAKSWVVILNDFFDNIDGEFYKSQMSYCLLKLSMWYPVFGWMNEYERIYNKAIHITIIKKDVHSIIMLMKFKVKYYLLKNKYIRKYADIRRERLKMG